jgi:hypothetical protein
MPTRLGSPESNEINFDSAIHAGHYFKLFKQNLESYVELQNADAQRLHKRKKQKQRFRNNKSDRQIGFEQVAKNLEQRAK